MKRAGCWHGVLLCGLAVFSFDALAQQSPAFDQAPKWGPFIDAEAKAGTKRNLGEADLFIPITQSADTLFFTDLRGRLDDRSSNEGNFGLGVRRMLPSGWNLGVYGYWDRRRTSFGSVFKQGTLGVEALAQDWDFRVNGYVPLGNRVNSLGTTGGISTAAIAGNTVQITTTGLTTREERALKGYDAEVGWRLPLFDVEDRSQLRLYLGGYRFSDRTTTVSGPRVRVQFALVQMPGLWQGAQLFLGAEAQRDSIRGSQQFLNVRLRIPFGGKAEQPRPLNWQERRMTAPIVRDVDIVSQMRVTSTPTVVETAITLNGQAITVLDSATTNTAAALNTALANAGATTVILSGMFNTNAQINMAAGQTILGSGSLAVTSASGHAATLSLPGATIAASGNSTVTALAMANNATLSGVTITNPYSAGSGNGVSAQGTTGVIISNNTITVGGMSGGYAIDLNATSNATVSGNTIIASSSGAASAIGIRTVGAGNATITNNAFSLAGTTNYVIAGDNTTSFAAGSAGNTTNGGVCFFVFGPPTGSVGFSTITCP